MRHLKDELETNFLIVDLGGDTTYNGLDFFLLADQKIVVSGTEPASILDSYTFVKVVFNRLLERFFSEHREQDATRAEILESASRIRREAKQQIDAGNMTLDGLTVEQINSVFNNAPRLRQSFRKILNIMTG